MLTITWSLAYIMCKQWIDDNKKLRQIACNFDCRVDVVVRCRAHCPNETHHGLHSKPLDAAIGQVLALHHRGGRHGRQFWMKTQNTNIFFMELTYGRTKSKAMRVLYPKLDPLLSSSMQQALFICEIPGLELKSLATFLCIKHYQGTKSKEVIMRLRSLLE